MQIINRKFEETLSISRDDLDDDDYGMLMPVVEELGSDAGSLPDKLVYEQLGKGRTELCMDGQPYFDKDHPAYDSNGDLFSYANIDTIQDGEQAQPWWYVFDTSRALKPIIFQPRRPFSIIAKTQLTSGNVFNDDEFVWGTDGRCAAGFGFHMFAYCTNRPPTADVFNSIVGAMASQCRRDGSPYGVSPKLVVGPKNMEGPLRTLLKSTLVPVLAPDGKTWVPGTNVWADYCDLLVADRLPQAVGN